jgi:hypothetical protein
MEKQKLFYLTCLVLHPTSSFDAIVSLMCTCFANKSFRRYPAHQYGCVVAIDALVVLL